VIATIPVGQAPQGVAYVPDAVPGGEGLDNLQPSGVAAQSVQLRLSPPGGKPTTQVTLFDQGLVQVLQAAVTGLEPKQPYVLALATQADGGGKLEPIASFMTNPAGAAILNTVGPIRQVVEVSTPETRHYLVIAPGSPEQLGRPLQLQTL
jgi:hypothetical protein